MRVYSGRGLGDFYFNLVRDLFAYGEKVTVRGHKCIEFHSPVTLQYTQPGACWMCIPGRRWNPFLAVAEVVWMLSGRGDIDWLANYSSAVRQFNDGESNNHGAYGLRIRNWAVPYRFTIPYVDAAGEDIYNIDQIEHIVRKLKEDPCSRQAVISIWDPVRDNLVKSKDYPCNNMVYYKLRNGVLEQTVIQRSNDLVLGTPINAAQFTHLHALVAGELGVSMGTYYHVIQNLHLYEDLYPEILANLKEHATFNFSGTNHFGAECVPGFGTVTNDKFNRYTLDKEKAPEGYWESTLPNYLRLFNNIKQTSQPAEECAVDLVMVPDPLRWLAIDFYSGSKNPFTQKVIELYRGLSEAATK